MWTPSATRSCAWNTTVRMSASRSPRNCRSRYSRAALQALESAEAWEAVCNRLSYHAIPMAPEDLDACRFRMQSSHVPLKQAFVDYAEECFAPGRSIVAAATDLMRKIHREFKYVPGSTTNRTSIVEVLEKRRGVCQDFAHFMIGCLRSSGLAARYVSGYIKTLRERRRGVGRCGCLARLGVGVLPAARLAGFRSHQRFTGRRGSCHGGLGPGLRRRVAASRHDCRRRPPQARGRSAGAGALAPTAIGRILESRIRRRSCGGSIGLGFVIYGRRQRAVMPLLCGLALIVFPYLVPNQILLVVVGVALITIPYFLGFELRRKTF